MSLVAKGTMFPDQLPGVNQSLLTPPTQEKEQLEFMVITAEPVMTVVPAMFVPLMV